MTDAPTRDALRAAYLEELGKVAPDADLDSLDPAEDLRDALDVDSMDLRTFVIALHKRLGVEVPERDYGTLMRLEPALDYLQARLAGG